MANNKAILTVVVIFLLIIGAYGGYRVYKHYQRLNTQSAQTQSPAPSSSTSEQASSPSATVAENTVNITAAGFSPQTVNIKVGQSVSWTNKDINDHTVNSDVHPTHLLYPPFNSIGLLKPGESKSLSFPKAGTYTYHDHLNPSLKGTIVVQ